MRHAGNTPTSICPIKKPDFVVLDEPPLPVIYRYFAESWQAESLASGRIWVSTLETCRAHEHPLQGDPKEGSVDFYSGTAMGKADEPRIQIITQRLGMQLGGGTVLLSNNVRSERIHDAYVICSTEQCSHENEDTFGRFCVRIAQPLLFFKAVTKALSLNMTLASATLGRLIYRDRSYAGLELPPGPLGFVKPQDYAAQHEVRMLWIRQDRRAVLEPFLLECDRAQKYCKRIS